MFMMMSMFVFMFTMRLVLYCRIAFFFIHIFSEHYLQIIMFGLCVIYNSRIWYINVICIISKLIGTKDIGASCRWCGYGSSRQYTITSFIHLHILVIYFYFTMLLPELLFLFILYSQWWSFCVSEKVMFIIFSFITFCDGWIFFRYGRCVIVLQENLIRM